MGRPKKNASNDVKKEKVVKKEKTESCIICGTSFEKKNVNHKYCSTCVHKLRRDRIKEKMKAKRKLSTFKSFSAFVDDESVVSAVKEKTATMNWRQRYAYLKKEYPSYIN